MTFMGYFLLFAMYSTPFVCAALTYFQERCDMRYWQGYDRAWNDMQLATRHERMLETRRRVNR